MSSAPLSFGMLSPPFARGYPLSRNTWTRIGALSILLWATWPALAIRTFEIPPLESLAIMFSVAWLVVTRIKEPELGDAGRFWSIRAWLPAVVFAVGLSGSDISFLLASHFIPAPQAHLISYLWPVMIVVFGAAVGLFRPHVRQFSGLFLGFVGTVILVWDGHVSMSIIGIGLALLSGACWAGYCVFRLLWKGPAGYLLARGCAISTLLCASLHFLVERTVVPGVGALGAAAVAGAIPLGLGNFFWDEGLRRGDGELLAVLTYATPLCSALLLTTLGAASLTSNLLIGAVIIVSAGFLSHTDSCESIKPQVISGRVA
jgi:drug/metabolite transporter (DMT)-like permease